MYLYFYHAGSPMQRDNKLIEHIAPNQRFTTGGHGHGRDGVDGFRFDVNGDGIIVE